MSFFAKSMEEISLRIYFNQLHVLTLGQRVRNTVARSRHMACYRHREGRQTSSCASRTLRDGAWQASAGQAGPEGDRCHAAMRKSEAGRERSTRCRTGLVMLGLHPDTPVMGPFGVCIFSEISVIPTRELPAPKVTYFKGSLQVKLGAEISDHRGAKTSNW